MEQLTRVEAFPRGSRVVHIGPPKTGTTAVQSALFRRRGELAAYGVAYPGRRRHERAAVSAVAFDELPAGLPAGAERRWQRFAREIRESTADRVVVSSEAFSFAPDSRLPRIVEDLGGSGLQVVVTARPLASIMPSRWQQSVQNYQIGSYQEWLERLFADGAADDPSFGPLWRRLRVDRLVQRWGAYVGEENVTLVVLDPADRSMLLSTFEGLLGLPTGFLAPAGGKPNESLPYPEIEMLRAFNRRFRTEGYSHALYVRAIRKRAMRQIKALGPTVMPPSPIVTPAWAIERANLVGAEMAEVLGSTAVRVIGDLAHLVGAVSDDRPSNPPTAVSVESAAEIAYAMFLAGRSEAPSERPAERPSERPAERPPPAQTSADAVAARDLAAELVRRARRRLRRG
jgi:hypothetical protein